MLFPKHFPVYYPENSRNTNRKIGKGQTVFTADRIHCWPYAPLTVFTTDRIHHWLYSPLTVFTADCIHCWPYSLLTVFIADRIQCWPYSLLFRVCRTWRTLAVTSHWTQRYCRRTAGKTATITSCPVRLFTVNRSSFASCCLTETHSFSWSPVSVVLLQMIQPGWSSPTWTMTPVQITSTPATFL